MNAIIFLSFFILTSTIYDCSPAVGSLITSDEYQKVFKNKRVQLRIINYFNKKCKGK